MPQPPGDPVPLNRTAHGPGDDEADLGSMGTAFTAIGMDNKIRLRCSYTAFDRGAEVCRPCHPVLSREHAE